MAIVDGHGADLARVSSPERRPLFRHAADPTFWLIWGLLGLLAVLIALPLLALFLSSLTTSSGGFTLSNYWEVVVTPRLLRTLLNTLTIGLGTAALATVIGVALAWVNARTNMPGARLFDILNLVPFFTPSFVGAIAWTELASQNRGLLNQLAYDWFGATEPIFNIYSPLGIIWVLALYEAPLVYLFVSGAFRQMDPSLEEAARMSGSGLISTALRITLPMAMPAMIGAALLIFVTVLGAFEVPLLLGIPARYPVLTTELFVLTSEYPTRYDIAAAMSMFLLVFTGIALVGQRKLLARRKYTTVTGKAYRPHALDIGRGKYAALAFNLLYVFVAIVLPFSTLLLDSFSKFWSGTIDFSNLTLDNYKYVLFSFEEGRRGLVNTLILASLGATLCVVLGLASSYLSFRSRHLGRGMLDLLSNAPLAIPAALLAVAVAVLWIRTPLYGTLWIILIAYVAKFLPYAQRSITTTLLSVSPELEESSRTSGASWWSTMRHVVLPILKPGIISGWLLVAIILIREFGIALFLYRPGSETLPVAIYLLMQVSPSMTAAACVVQVLITLAALLVLRTATRGQRLGL